MSDLKTINKTLQEHEKRIRVLEGLPDLNERNISNKQNNKKYKGVKGGILLLIEHGFFKKKRIAADVRTELEKRGYIYQRSVVQTTINRLSVKKGPLTSVKEGKSKVYVERK